MTVSFWLSRKYSSTRSHHDRRIAAIGASVAKNFSSRLPEILHFSLIIITMSCWKFSARFILINVVVLERPTGTWMSRHGTGGWEWFRRALRWTSNSKTKCQASSLPTVLWRHTLAWPSSRSRTAHDTLCCAYKTTTDDQPSLAWDLV